MGPHNYQQIETLHAIGQLLLNDGKSKAAKKIRRRIYYLETREARLSPSRPLPGLEQQALP